jgi:integrase
VACIRKRRGKWVVDYRDAAGIRRWVTCETRRLAEDVLSAKLQESRQPTRPVVDPDITLADYAERWLVLIGSTVKPRTLDGHRYVLDLHVLPMLGRVKVRQLHKGQIRAFLALKLESGRLPRQKKGDEGGEKTKPVEPAEPGLARGSVRIIYSTLRALLNAAVDDGVILANPATHLERKLRIVTPPSARREEIKAMTREQLEAFLTSATEHAGRSYPLLLLLARTGMRLGEALALHWDDVDFGQREIRVARAFSGGRLETPKSGHGRTVDMSQQLAKCLLRLHIDRKAETLKRGWSAMPPWVFCSEVGTPLQVANVRRVFARTLRDAKLPGHFSPHCLRHTHASLLLQQGESPVYVQRQLGHSSIKLTVDTYGRWLPMGNKAAVDRLDGATGSKVVAKPAAMTKGAVEPRGKVGEAWRIRTSDSLLKRQELYLAELTPHARIIAQLRDPPLPAKS